MTCHPEHGCPPSTHNLHCGFPNCEKGRAAKARASVRVVEAPKPPEPMRSRCRCGALLEFDEAAVQYGPEHQIDGRDAFVLCPHCKADHHVSAKNTTAVFKRCGECTCKSFSDCGWRLGS